MSVSFVAYIDESGDEGFNFKKGSPEWFVLSAVITQKESDLETVKLVDHVRTVIGIAEHKPLHFRELSHEKRLPFIHSISQAKLKTISIIIYKPSITEPENFNERNRLYFYASRLLLERISWYCRDYKTPSVSGDGTVDIIFSNRAGMKYEEFKQYLETLKLKTELDQVRIDWNIIRSEQITSYIPTKRMGLQIADAIASGIFFGVRLSQYGFAEDRYIRWLKPVIYQHKGIYKGYGLKLWPNESLTMINTNSHLNWLKVDYGF